MLTEIATEPSRHKCLIYEGHPSEQLPVVIPFLREGLQENWRCLYVGSPEMLRMIDSALLLVGINPAREIERGTLVLSSERTLADNGDFDPKLMVEGLSAMAEGAVRDGFTGLCATGDMVWELGALQNFDRLLEYEAHLEEAFRRLPLRGICQYQRDLVPPEAVREALATHRSTYVGDVLDRDNLFYTPPEILLEDGPEAATRRSEWMCQQIVRVLKAERHRDEALTALRMSESQQRFLAEQLAEMNQSLERRVNERTGELEAANRQLEAFSYSVSHDLHGPLQSILSFSEILGEQFGHVLGATGQRHLNRLRDGAIQMRELIEGLMALSGVVRVELEREAVNLSAMAGEVMDDIRETEPARPAEVIVEPGLHAVGDRALLRAVFSNLLGNAWKFTAKCSRTRIEVGKFVEPSGETIFFVADNGAGFDMQQVGKLFSAFERLHNRSEYAGTGIGLATVQRIIAAHGGRIWAEGRPNHGATFFFTLPVVSRESRVN